VNVGASTPVRTTAFLSTATDGTAAKHAAELEIKMKFNKTRPYRHGDMKIEEKRFEAVRDYLEDVNPEAMLFDGFEDALVGTCDRFNQPTLAAYDKCIEILAKDMTTVDDDDDPYTMAVEYFDFNVIGAYIGDSTPVFIRLHEGD